MNNGLPVALSETEHRGEAPHTLSEPSAADRASRHASGSIDNIQVLRAVAALLVVFVHLDQFLRALGVPPFGHGGVDLFFVISGFIMVYTTRSRPIGPVAFMVNRITRIAPIYWLITLAVYAVALAAPSLLQATSASLEQLAKSLLFIPFQKSNGLVQPVLFVGWTLNFEMFFYAVFALGLMFPERRVGALVVMSLLAGLVLVGAVFQPRGVVAEFYTRPIIIEFAAGMALAWFGGGLTVASAVARRALTAVIVLGALALALVPLWAPDVSRVLTQGVPATVVATSAIVLHQSGVRWSSRVPLLLGNASYSLYLTHPFVTQAAQKAGKLLGLTPVVAVVLMAVTLVAVCVVGVITHLAIEKPLTRLAKAFADRLVVGQKPAVAPRYVRAD
jgi:exopolysaccharide production protein ExoZ